MFKINPTKRNETLLVVNATESELKFRALNNALKEARLINNYEVIGVPAKSNVGENPCGNNEILTGCINRLRSAVRFTRKDLMSRNILYCASESGIITNSPNIDRPTLPIAFESATEYQRENYFLPDLYMKEGVEWFGYTQCLMWYPNLNGGIKDGQEFLIDRIQGTINFSKSESTTFPTHSVIKTWKRGRNSLNGFKLNTVGEIMEEDGLIHSSKDPDIDLPPFISRVELLTDAFKFLLV